MSSFISSFFGCIPFIITFIFILTWAYTFVFRQNIVQTYSVRNSIPKRQINEYIRRNINDTYGTGLVEVNMEGVEDDEYTNIDKPNMRGEYNSTWNRIIGAVFSLSFSFSVELIILMMCELIDVFDERARLFCFKFIITSLVFLLTCIQPFMMISLFLNEELIPVTQSNLKRTYTVVAYLGWFFILHKCGDLSQAFTPDKSSLGAKTLIERKINEISIAGITTMAILSGVGSTSTPFKVFSIKQMRSYFKNDGLYTTNKGRVNEADINNLIQSYNHTTSLINKRKKELNKLQVANGGTVYNLPNTSSDNFLLYNSHKISDLGGSPKKNKLGGLLNKVQSFASLSSLSLDREKLEEKELRNEIDSMISLRQHIYNDLVKTLFKFSYERDQLQNKNKLWVKAMNIFNVAFALYCVYRIINVFIIKQVILFLKTPNQDESGIINDYNDEAVTNTDALAITISKLILSTTQLSMQETQLVNQISLILSGSLFICSFSNVLKTFQSFTKFFPSITKISATTKDWLKNLVITELLGIYVISTAILIRTNLPTNLSNQISKILSLTGTSSSNALLTSAKEVQFIDDWFDKIFGIACASTLTVFVIKLFLDDEADDIYDEEMMLEDNATSSSSSYKTA
ncbi:unnamed protein product [Debaryomyces fabryi]|nr:unnamed protein product [Debaryomyces fabryi]